MSAAIWGGVVAIDRLCLIANKINDIEYQLRINKQQQNGITDDSGGDVGQTTRSEQETNQQDTSAKAEDEGDSNSCWV